MNLPKYLEFERESMIAEVKQDKVMREQIQVQHSHFIMPEQCRWQFFQSL